MIDSIVISNFFTLIAYLKRKNIGNGPKKASVFTKEEMFNFSIEASDDTFLIQKVNLHKYFQKANIKLMNF